MAHKAQLENKKYRNWVRAGLGIKYVKEGLEPFCDYLVNQQHVAILDKVKQKHNVSAVSCGQCDIRTLQPDHVKTKTRQCPLGQIYCNCLHSRGKMSCPNKVCGAIYDEIIQCHASTPPSPNWRNTDAQQWCTEPWSVAKCFIKAPGYEKKIRAVEFDCPGLLHVLINNIDFHQHIKCVITGTDVFSRVRTSRNDIFHSNRMELEDTEVNSYIDDMIELLEDETEIKHRQESKAAIKKLQELKQEEFIISTTDEAEIRRDAMAAINEKERELKQTIADAGDKLKTTANEEKHDIEGKGSVIKSELEQTGKKISKDLAIKEAELEQTGRNIKTELVIKEDESKKKIEQKLIDIEKKLTSKEVEATEKLEQKLQESKLQLESHKKLIEGSMTSTVETRKEYVTSREKTDFQKRLVKLYQTHVGKVAPLPRLHKDLRSVSEMYVPPWMTVEKKNEESNESKEVKISMDEIFRHKEGPAKNIYVIGEAGSGKTTFCKMLVHYWCIAHPYQGCSLDVPGIVKEIQNFEFLFYISLRHFFDCDSIEKMLKKSYSDPALRDILQNDSGKCLIVLDGLDEWIPERKHSSQFLTPGLPERELDSDYTIMTTSRQWKFDALPISDSEVDKKIKLNGIDAHEIEKLTTKTVETLNDIYQKNKNAVACITDLQIRQVSDISSIPLMLQQLVCLWFNDKLQDNSKCAIYRSMVDLFLEWKALGTVEIQEPLFDVERDRKNTRAIQYLSHLAHETLFDKNKENTLAFRILTLTRMNIPDDVIKDCLNSGILKQELNVSLCESIQSSISFFHKSMQEYLAAVYIASQFREMLKSHKDEHYLTDICKKCVRKYFGSCKTVVDILEQSNVLVMLCGLEPRLLTHISEYIYNVTLVDKMVIEERNKLPENYSLDYFTLINDIQACVLKCIEEVMSVTKNVRLPVYIADIHVDPSTDLLRYGHNIVLKNVLSIEIVDNVYSIIERYNNDYNEAYFLAVKHLIKCDQLKVIKFTFFSDSDERIKNEVTTMLETNIHTLETISLRNKDKDIITITRLVSILPEMRQLTSLQVETFGIQIAHDDILPLCKFLNQTTSLQHIWLDISCSKYDKHTIDLSKHQQLQHVDLVRSAFSMVSCNTDNLETCKLTITSDDMMNQVCNSLYKAGQLKHLLYDASIEDLINNADCRTENLIRLLPSLVSLCTLTLRHFTLTDNVISRPCDIKTLKEITLDNVTMCISTWCKFIDNLPELPQVVKVKIYNVHIRDGTISGYRMSDKKQDETAHQYVRKKTNLFRVTRDRTFLFQFTTKK